VCDYEVLGTEQDLKELSEKYGFNAGIIAIGDNFTRKIMVDKIVSTCPTFNFISAIHPNAVIGKDVRIGAGTAIMAGVIVNCSSKVGSFCILNTNSSLGHDGRLGNFSSLAPNATLGGNVHIGELTAICLGANIVQDIKIGKNTIIGAASLVLEDVPDYVLVYGTPANIVRKISIGEKYLQRHEYKLLINKKKTISK